MLTVMPSQMTMPTDVATIVPELDNRILSMQKGLTTYDVEIPYYINAEGRSTIIDWYTNFGWLNVECVWSIDKLQLHIESPIPPPPSPSLPEPTPTPSPTQ